MTGPGEPWVERVLAAPPELGRFASGAFRQAGIELLDQLPAGHGRLIIELGTTQDADSAGLAALIAIRRRARARGHAVRLRGVTPALFDLLRTSKLDGQFDIER